ncbi:transcription factor bHLH95-like [Tripterygium wilfordii]|uniref:Transcription factor bHLH95-like n=1 Tax=Tripterygium wilfordii TaxID=458696 RepID=A0A7J7DGY3_TRIWF|nr:transcription factor bHLH95-like [Tripterygium wilfordii]
MSDEKGHGGALWENLLLPVINSKLNNQDNKPLGSDSNIDQTPQQASEWVMSSQKEEEREEGIRKKRKGSNEAKDKNGGGGGGGDGLEDQEMTTHMLMERRRRRKMKDMFSELHVLLFGPHAAKADKSTIIDEAVSKIKSLEEEIKIKEKQKEQLLKQKNQIASNTNISREAFLANQAASTPIASIDVGAVTGTGSSSSSSYSNGPIMFQTWNFMNVVLSICGNEAQYFVCSSKKQLGLMSSIIFVFEKYGVDVISANLSTHGNKRTYTFQARLTGISHEVGKTPPIVVKLFKQAAKELSLLVCSE